MTQPADQNITAFEDISATDFKRHFGQTLDQALQGRAVRITRHGRERNRLVLIREADLQRLNVPSTHPLDALRERFDTLLADMQQPAARNAVAQVATAGDEAFGEAAVKAFRTSE